MDLAPFLPWLVFVHVVGAFVFAAGHGVSLFVVFQLRRARNDPARMAALLELSQRSVNWAGVGLLILLVSGIVAGIVAGSFGRLWIWVSLVLLIVVGGLMTPFGASYLNQIRVALGIRPERMKKEEPDPVPLPPDQVAALLDRRNPEVLLVVGSVGFVVILYLMMFRPF